MKNVIVVKGTLGRNEKGQFVNLSTVSVASTETPETPETVVPETVATTETPAPTEASAPAPKAPKTPKAPKAPQPVIVFTSATYGSSEKNIEVADKLVLGRKITNKLVGEDPHPKMKKTLFVKATIDGTPVEKTFNEGDKLIF